MGVDYSANFGIGFQIRKPKNCKEIEENFEGDFHYWYSEKIEPELEKKYTSFEVGDSGYTGGENEMYVVIEKELREGWETVKKEVEALKKDLLQLDLINEYDEAEIVGGLHVH